MDVGEGVFEGETQKRLWNSVRLGGSEGSAEPSSRRAQMAAQAATAASRSATRRASFPKGVPGTLFGAIKNKQRRAEIKRKRGKTKEKQLVEKIMRKKPIFRSNPSLGTRPSPTLAN